jgi:uncharacterized repeat protein (TIGR03803 family)
MTHASGSTSGTIFSIGTDGTGFTVLHSFTGGSNDGKSPYGSLLLSGSKLYGMTSSGGSANLGTIFSFDASGSNFSVLDSFAGGNDGQVPLGSLTQLGSHLYGMTPDGGSAGDGTLFQIDTDGSNYSLLHTFTGAPSDGRLPKGALLAVGPSTLYGMTDLGGASDQGTIFSITVPEPSSLFLAAIALGVGGLFLAHWRRRRFER